MTATPELTLLATMAQYNGMSMIAVDRNACITHVIGDIKHALTTNPHAAVGKTIDYLFADYQDIVQRYNDALDNRPSKITVCTKTGGYSDIQFVPILDNHGNICGALGFETDTTEREKAIQTRKERERELESLFCNAKDGIYHLDRNFVIQRANAAAKELHGGRVPGGQLEGHVCYKQIFGVDEPCGFCPATKTLQTGQPTEGYYFDETIQKHLQLNATPLFDPQTGELTGVFETVRDITEQIGFEAAIRARDNLEDLVNERIRDLDQSKSNIRAIFAEGNVPIAFADSDGHIVFINASFQALTGYPEEELLGKSLFQTIYDEKTLKNPQFLQEVESLYAGKIDQHRQDVMIRQKNGETRWIDFTASAVKDAEGNRTQIIFICTDITERYKMAQEVSEASELAHLMFESSPIPCTLLDKDLKVIDCNPEVLKLFNVPTKKIYRERFVELFPKYQPDGSISLEAVFDKFAEVFDKGHLNLEWLLQELDGGMAIPLDITLVRIKWEEDYVIAAYGRDLREERRMLAELREADERAKIMLDATPLGCSLIDINGNIIDCNLEARKLLGISTKQDYCKRFLEMMPEYQPNGLPSKADALEKISEAFRTGYLRFEWMHRKSDGTPLPVEVVLVRINRGKEHIIAGYTRDLREEKRMIAKMRESDERTQIMLDAMPMGSTLVGGNGQVLDCNLASLKMFGFSDKQEFCERFFELSPEYQPDGQSSKEGAVGKITATLETGYQRFEWMHQKHDGTPIPTEVTLVRGKMEDSYFLTGYIRDLREIKKHEAIQEQNRQRMIALLELSQMTQQSETEIIEYALKSIVSLTGSTMGYVLLLLEHTVLPFRSLINQSFHCPLPALADEGTPHIQSRVLTECLSTGQVVLHDDVALLPGPRTFPEGHHPVHAHMNVSITSGEKTIGILGVGNKATPYDEAEARHLMLLAQGLGNLLNRKKYTEDLETARDEAERANKAKSEFLAHMSHEIRTPLNGVIGLSDLLTGTPLNEKQLEYVQLINDSGKSLLFLINDILDFSKIEAGKLEVFLEPFDLSGTVGAVLAALVPRASAKNLELGVSLCQNLPQIVYGDSGRIRQILTNLMGNAVKFTEKGGVRVDVTVESVAEKTLTVKFSVIDTGIGIPTGGIDRLFKAFTQIDASVARVYGGTGLGLAISMKLVRIMGGDIGVESEEGKGSNFWFTVPFECDAKVIQCILSKECTDRTCPDIDGSLCTAIVNRDIDADYKTEGRLVLIVDDNEAQVQALSIQLKNWGMECVVCGSGREALRLVEEYQKRDKTFDLLIIDSVFSDGNGIDLTRKLLEWEDESGDFKCAQIILLRSLSEEFDMDALDEDRIESVSKPVFSSSLFNAVMNRIFAEEVRKAADSGILSLVDMDNLKKSRSKTPRRVRPVSRPLIPMDRLKSHLSGRVHILVVEDNRVNQIVARNLLEESGFTCEIASNGVEACNAVRNKEYDVILMDCQMPEMDGFDATKLIRNWEREYGKKRVPIIALTANATKEDVKKCFDVGMDAYCSKPVNPVTIISQIEEWYEGTHIGN